MERLTPDIFFVDDLLNLSNDDEFDESFTDSPTNSILADSSNSSSLSHCEPLFSHTSPLSDHLCLPNEELAELEWLSNIVEESFSQEDQDKLQLLSGLKIPQPNNLDRFKPEFEFKPITNTTKPTNNSTCHEEVTIPAKARSKRSRSAASTWQSRLLAIEYGPKMKLFREKLEITARERRCMHCATEKTPQWRTGPMGPKTLCNACGVRYKSGRLVPEYRPAASPTFELSKHSNSHRKVVELRRQKQRQEDYLVMSKVDGEDMLMEVRSNGEDYLISNNVNNHFRQF